MGACYLLFVLTCAILMPFIVSKAPGYLRFGGTFTDYVQYQVPGSPSTSSCPSPTKANVSKTTCPPNSQPCCLELSTDRWNETLPVEPPLATEKNPLEDTNGLRRPPLRTLEGGATQPVTGELSVRVALLRSSASADERSPDDATPHSKALCARCGVERQLQPQPAARPRLPPTVWGWSMRSPQGMGP